MTAEPGRGAFDTPQGVIEFELYPQLAPASCAGFVDSIAAGGWARASFLRAVREDNDQGRPRIDVVQALGNSPAPRPIEHESTRQTGLSHLAGTLSLARAEVGTATGDQIFICVADSPHLDAGGLRQPDGLGFAAFGRITSGMNLLALVHQSECVDGGDAYTAGQILRHPLEITSVLLEHTF